MPIMYSATRAESPYANRVLWVDDYLHLIKTNLMTPITGSFGFKTYIPSTAKHLLTLSPDEYLDFFSGQLQMAEDARKATRAPVIAAKPTITYPYDEEYKPIPFVEEGEVNVRVHNTVLSRKVPFDEFPPDESTQGNVYDELVKLACDREDEVNAFDEFIKQNRRKGSVSGNGLDRFITANSRPVSDADNAPEVITKDQAHDLSVAGKENALDVFIKDNSRNSTTETAKSHEVVQDMKPVVVINETSLPTIVEESEDNDFADDTSSVSADEEFPAATRSEAFQKVIDIMRPPQFHHTYAVHYHKAAGRPTGSANDYTSRQTVMCDSVFDVDTFWRVFNNMPWARIPARDSAHIFVRGVLPQWEDERNIKGGSYTIRIKREGEGEDEASGAKWVWEEVCMAACGGIIEGAFDDEDISDNLLGVSFRNFGDFVTIALWLENGKGRESVASTITNKVLDNESKPLVVGEGHWKWHHQCAGWEDATGMEKSEVMEV